MENRLRKLRSIMNDSTFNQLQFTERHRNRVHDKINKENESKEDICLAALQLLLNKKTGFELIQLLHARGLESFKENEGNLYTLLHELEQNGYVISDWNDKAVKYYQTSEEGKAVLEKEKKKEKHSILIRKIAEE
ncbi:lineage-specific thermal regulator protein [Paraliobacillus sp. PM-2]|uniref:PadR family transcriptional regulator n=1 Tax=Paraliobacillus sp. PM-2 TaxID=1462524 RepID=UPI00061C90D2|nr:PadR family transcriptional regulator [Paraliobacillus sp. PM-2]CQR48079.1 lineage-specific thermal regulator protein [Paraliobacillus sp. PM-2]